MGLLRFFLFSVSTIALFFYFANISIAQEISLGIANYFEIIGGDISDGDIVSLGDEGYLLSDKTYDPRVIGIVAENPAVSISLEGRSENSYPVVSSGNVRIKVSTVNGEIKEGDLLTTSEIGGVAMKAINSGYIVGTALEAFNEGEDVVGKINVALNLHYSYTTAELKTSLFDILQLSALATYENPLTVFRYFIAGLVVISSIIIGFLSFGRIASLGLEALGRNPLASSRIQLGIIINTVITIVIIIAGVSIAYFIVTIG